MCSSDLAQGLAVALRPRHTKVTGQIFFQCTALAVADDRHRQSVKTGDAAQNGRVFLALTVAALLKEVGEQGDRPAGIGLPAPDGPDPARAAQYGRRTGTDVSGSKILCSVVRSHRSRCIAGDSGVYQPIPDPEFICTYPKTVGRFDAGGQADRGRRFEIGRAHV